MLHVLPPSFEPVLQSFFSWVVKSVTALSNSFAAKSENKFYVFSLLPVLPSLLHSRFWCRHATLLPTTLKTAVQQTTFYRTCLKTTELYKARNSCNVYPVSMILGAIHSTKVSGNFGPKLNGSVRSNRKSFEKTGPPFEVVLFSRSDRSECWLNGSRPLMWQYRPENSLKFFFKLQARHGRIQSDY